MFIDIVKIYVKAGDGGNGAIAFHREKYVPNGGPDGGDGGRGGNIIFRVDEGANTLLAFRYKRKFVAESGKIIFDMSRDREFIACRGGRGGWGNRHFATPTRQIPRFAKSGTKGEEKELQLELKMLADVGLLGFPNVGKSSLLARVSAAKPKIANYHFTTLSPNLGVVRYYDNAFVAADIPGLIEGASKGAGLGHDFLRHIERTRMLCHVVDISGCEGRDPIEDFKKINTELKDYSETLAALPQVIVCNKCDVFGAKENLSAFRKKFGRKYKIFPVTAVTGEGTEKLIEGIFSVLETLPPVQPVPVEEDFEYASEGDLSYEIVRDENGVYVVMGGLVDMLCRNVVLNNPDSMQYFQKVLRSRGVIQSLKDAGCGEGDTVSIGDVEFDFVE